MIGRDLLVVRSPRNCALVRNSYGAYRTVPTRAGFTRIPHPTRSRSRNYDTAGYDDRTIVSFRRYFSFAVPPGRLPNNKNFARCYSLPFDINIGNDRLLFGNKRPNFVESLRNVYSRDAILALLAVTASIDYRMFSISLGNIVDR